MPVSASLDEALEGLGALLAGDATLAALVGTDEAGAVRVYEGWPSDVLANPQPADFPRVTFYRVPGGDVRRPRFGIGRVRIRVNLFVWPQGDTGGSDRRKAIDSRIVELLDEQHWTHADARLYATASEPVDLPTGPGAPLTRVRPIDVDVSPAP